MVNVNDRALANTGTKAKGTGQFRPSSIESAVEQSQMRYSTSVAVAAAATAVRACREASEAKESKDAKETKETKDTKESKAAALEACILRATAPDAVVLGAIRNN